MNVHDIINALGSKETLKGYFGTFLTITFGLIDLEKTQQAVAITGGFFGIVLTMISIYTKIQEKIKNDIEISSKMKRKNED